MKRTLLLLTLLALCLCTCTKQAAPDSSTPDSGATVNETMTGNGETVQGNNVISIDESKIIRVNVPDCLPISTTSIRDIFEVTGRFEYSRITLPPGGGAVADVYFHLVKPYDENTEGAAYVSYQVLSENTTQIIICNFRKSEVNGKGHDAIRWALDLLMHIFETELTEKTWEDILEVAAKSETEDDWGTDYEGYSDEINGIRLVYVNLGSNVQIEIRPY